MIAARMKKSVAAMLVAAVILGAIGTAVENGQAQDAPKAASKDATKPKKRAKPRGRLPAFYGKVVDRKQREQIYAIQKSHAAEIAKLRAQLKDLMVKRDTEVAAVLTAEQQTEVAKLAAAAKAKREKRAAEKKAASKAAAAEK